MMSAMPLLLALAAPQSTPDRDWQAALRQDAIGQVTSADTLYMDVRSDPSPSGLGRAVVPMKVYRGRPRGANVPWEPVHRFTGDLRDTAALERWVATLP